jgi:hypothetical protein
LTNVLLTANSSNSNLSLGANSVPDPIYGSIIGSANLNASLANASLTLFLSAPFQNASTMTLDLNNLIHTQHTGSPSPDNPFTISTNKRPVISSGDFNVAGGDVTATTFIGALNGNASTATNIAGGDSGRISYQTAINTTAFTATGTT